MERLDKKIALISGAGSGIGAASARHLAQAGASVILVGRRAAPLHALTEQIRAAGGQAQAYPLDVTDAVAVRESLAHIRATLGVPDILVHSAGSAGRVRNAQYLSADEWQAIVDLNLSAVFTLTRAWLPEMLARGAGTVITISSMAAIHANLLGGAAYGAAKAGVRNFSHYLHNTYRNQGLRATVILPGEVDTPIMAKRARTPDAADRATMLQAEDVARAVLLCATLEARAVIPELQICPTVARDLAAARALGAA